jgi:pimeloyl-ACP methyl ester carboxylesterase
MKKSHVAAVLCLLLVIGVCHITRAQEVSLQFELRARLEEFNNLYTRKRREGVSVAAVEPLRQQAEAAFKVGNTRGVLETVSRGIALLQGRQWDERQKFLSSLTVKVDRLVLDSNRDLQVSLVRMFPSNLDQAFATAPTVTFELKPEEAAPVETGVETPAAAPNAQTILIGERRAISQESTIASRRMRLSDGAYWLVARLESAGQPVVEIKKPIYAINDFSERLNRLSSLVAVIKNSTDPKVKAVAPQVWTPFFHLQRLASLNQSRGPYEINALVEFDRIESILSSLANGLNPFGKERGEVERAFMASDGMVVPYRVYIPQSYDGTAARPLLLLLPGAFGDERSFFSGLYDPVIIKGESERRGVIMVSVNGGGRARATPGDDDALETINAVTRDYKIDSSRIFLIGHSTGALRAWTIATAKPELFAAVASISTGTPPQNDEAGALLAKAKGLPALVIHGTKDGVAGVDNSRKLQSQLQKAGVKAELIEVPEADHLSVVGATFPAVMQFFERNEKKPASK